MKSFGQSTTKLSAGGQSNGIPDAIIDSGLCIEDLYSHGCSNGSNGLISWTMANIIVPDIPCSGYPEWYHDYTGMTHHLTAGATYTITTGADSENLTRFSVWIDFNDDFILTEDETIFEGLVPEETNSVTFEVTIPEVVPGTHVMRVRSMRGTINYLDPCATYDYGNCFDFKAEILAPVNETGVTNITSPVSSPTPGMQNVTIQVTNYGTAEQTNLPVSFSVDGGEPVFETIPGTIQPGETRDYTFSTQVDLSVWGIEGHTYYIEACTNLEGDEIPANDCSAVEATIYPIISISPAAINQSLYLGETDTQAFTIQNNGNVSLDYSLGINLESQNEPMDNSGLCVDSLYTYGCTGTFGSGMTYWSFDGVEVDIECSETSGWYHNFTDRVHHLIPGQVITLTVNSMSIINPSGDLYLDIWIDFNDDLQLTDDELIFDDGVLSQTNVNVSFDVTIPNTALPGYHLMRCRSSKWYPLTDACENFEYGNCCDFVAFVDMWFGTSVTTGTIAPGDSEDITVIFNAEDINIGTYFGYITIQSNDLSNPSVNLPVTLEVPENHNSDIGVQYIVSPISNETLTFEDVTVVVKNFGSNPQMDIPIQYTIDGQNPVVEVIPGTLAPGATVEYIFLQQADLTVSSTTTFSIEACTMLAADENTNNDCSAKEVLNTYIPHPVISADPLEINREIVAGGTATRVLSLENNGDAPLAYNLTAVIDPENKASDQSGLCTENLYSEGCIYGDGIIYWDLEDVNIPEIPCTGTPSYYQDYTSMNHDLIAGSTYILTVMIGGYGAATIDVWIDFNNNLQLTDDEIILNDAVMMDALVEYTFEVQIPEDALNGSHIMRVRERYGDYVYDACETYEYGNCCDFTATITGGTIMWLTTDETAGVLQPGETKDINVTMDATELQVNTYSGFINIYSNDPVTPLVEIPVSLEVKDKPWEFMVTGLTHTIQIPASVHPDIFGEPLASGDWVGVFYTDNYGNEICGGAKQISPFGNATVTAYGDDITTCNKDGFADGETFRWKMYDISAGMEYDAIVVYDESMPNQGNFAELGLSKITEMHAVYGQQYWFSDGWNSISSYIIPFDSDVTNLFSPVTGQLVIMRNLTKIYWPGENVNTIGNFDNESGYAIKFTDDVQFNISGEYNANPTITLEAGWHYLPVLSECPASIAEVFGQYIDNVVIIQDLIGTYVYWPDMAVYTLEELQPGLAYKIKLSGETSVAFPECFFKSSAMVTKQTNKLSTPWGEIIMTPSSQIVAILQPAMEQLQKDDAIGVFDDNGRAYGYLNITSTSKNQALVIFGNDPSSSAQNGFESGEEVSYKLFRTSTGEEFNMEVEYDNTMDNNSGKFQSGSFAAITNINMKNTETGHIQNSLEIYPNPANDELSIKLNESELGLVSLTILDATGQTIVEKTFIDKINLNVSSYPGGVYFVKINSGNFNEVRKIVIR
ncbi:MAG TPA: T9SS type A sorting domain-containing protein [Bacteroidales bacterium]|nr:T9SS type A sorting domain-containing protein [Bacteroidales bacterium]